MQLIWPHYLRPIPSTTLIAFTPKPTLKQSMTIPAEIQIASVPVEGTSCLFKTTSDVEIHPLNLLDASFSQPSGRPPFIKLLLELNRSQTFRLAAERLCASFSQEIIRVPPISTSF